MRQGYTHYSHVDCGEEIETLIAPRARLLGDASCGWRTGGTCSGCRACSGSWTGEGGGLGSKAISGSSGPSMWSLASCARVYRNPFREPHTLANPTNPPKNMDYWYLAMLLFFSSYLIVIP